MPSDEDSHADGETGSFDDNIAWPYLHTSSSDELELAMSFMFIIVSIIIFTYIILALYPFCCPRHYDKYRHPKRYGRKRSGSLHTSLLRDVVVTALKGHMQVCTFNTSYREWFSSMEIFILSTL